MAVSSGAAGPTLTQEILSHLGLANKPAAWGTLGTLRTFLSFSVDKDVQRLLRAIAGQAVDHSAIIDVLTNRSREQRQLLSRAFRERTQQDLLKTLQAALSGNLESVVVALLQPTAQADAQQLRAALKGGRENYCGITDYNLAEQDVQALQQVEGPGTEGTWVVIFTQRNPEHLRRVFDLYQWCTGQALEEAVRDRFHGDAQAALLSLASVARNTPLYFADKLHRGLQETEPNYQVLMRILISRCEIDLLSIRAEFKKKFGKSLYSSLQIKALCQLESQQEDGVGQNVTHLQWHAA
ncbi:PREDICTED: annexin A9 isoform X3 [Chinchilla lanigera]|uniref:annexin A9 isoform X3 n=1 Tax=Chinchilla lanigera TaxID=34839 RepID=UPI0006984641|nr:PREDICTED: annexin A9 isoform X3 [Chinchilla lanigera]